MSILDWLPKKNKDAQAASSVRLNIPGDLWVKCFHCNEIIYLKDLEANYKVCPKCQYHFRLTPEERIRYLLDEDSFTETETNLKPWDFLSFSDTESYADRLEKSQAKTKRHDAMLTGLATINGQTANIGLMDFGFMGGSMGSVVGEKVTRLLEKGAENRCPVIIFTSSGGARMQEGILSLMQMAKTSAAVKYLEKASVPFISVLCDPTTGGTSASFAMLGDILIAEPGAFISFAGPRVIEQTIRQKLPAGFQRAEFLLEHGMIDMVVARPQMKNTLAKVITLLQPPKGHL